jgi:sugar-specific transcriptional regulator TrmB
LLADKKRELDQQAEQYEEIVDDLVGELETAEPVEETFWTAAVGSEESADLLVERLAAADDSIVVVAASLTRQFDIDEMAARVTAALEAALERGVTVSVLMTPALVETLPPEVGQRYRETLQDHERFETRTSPDVTGTFEVIDETEVCIEVPHPLHNEETFAVIDLKDPDFAADVRSEFQPRWDGAEVLRL